jgi:hypothetical protein
MIMPPRQPDAVIAKAMLAAAVDHASQPATAEELAALDRLLAHAQRDSGQSRVVADFLLAWWNSGSCGAFDLTSLWSLDRGPFDFSARSDGSRPPAERALARGSLCALTQVLVRQ